MDRLIKIQIEGILYSFGYVKESWEKALEDAKILFVQDHNYQGNFSILAVYYTFQQLNKGSFKLTRDEFFKVYYQELNIGFQALNFMMRFAELPIYN